MVLGILNIIAGIFIFVYPKLLALLVASMFIFVGIIMIYISVYYRRMSHRFNDPVFDFIFHL